MTEREFSHHAGPALQGLDDSINPAGIISLRPKTFSAMNTAYEVLLHENGGQSSFGKADRMLCAWQTASLVPHPGLAERYRTEAHRAGANEEQLSPRQDAMLHHVTRMVKTPAEMTPEDIARLREAGFTVREIIELAQVVAFVAYQARVLHGLRLFAGAR